MTKGLQHFPRSLNEVTSDISSSTLFGTFQYFIHRSMFWVFKKFCQIIVCVVFIVDIEFFYWSYWHDSASSPYTSDLALTSQSLKAGQQPTLVRNYFDGGFPAAVGQLAKTHQLLAGGR
jgi:hypothetical protein